MKKIIFVSLLALTGMKGISQITVNAGPDKCANPTATLTASATITSYPATTGYTAAAGTYSWVTPGGTNLFSTISRADDVWLKNVNLGFNFSYFGTTYSQICIGANGKVTFDLTKQGSYDSWVIDAGLPGGVHTTTAPVTPLPNNTICALHRDIDPRVTGDIYVQTIGTAPCRSFVVSWVNVPLYNYTSTCASFPTQTFQLILRESSNIIDVNIQKSNACTAWNNGRGIVGIQGTQSGGTSPHAVVSTRNATAWNPAANEAWRFSPNGATTQIPYTGTFTWTGPSGVIGTGASINVSPTTGTIYTASASYTNCNGTTYNGSDWTYVNGTSNPAFNFTVTYQPNYFTVATTPADVSQPNNWDFNYCHRVELWTAGYTTWYWQFDYCKNEPSAIWSNYPNAEVYKGFDHYTQTYNTNAGVYNGSTYTMPTSPTPGRFKYNQYYRLYRATANSQCGWRETFVELRVVPAGKMHNGVLLKEPLLITSEPRPVSELDASIYANGPTGIVDEVNLSDLFQVYPNPSTGVFTVDVYNDSKATLQVIDITGKTIKTVQLNKYDNYTLDLSGYAKGAYMIKVNDEQQQQLKKIVIE